MVDKILLHINVNLYIDDIDNRLLVDERLERSLPVLYVKVFGETFVRYYIDFFTIEQAQSFQQFLLDELY